MKSAALLIGLNYKGTSNELTGCIIDIVRVRSWLKGQGFEDITVLTDGIDGSTTSHWNILKQLVTLSQKSWSQSLDVAWIHYSGHGMQMKDMNSEEKDGNDECLVPSDCDTVGPIRDDELGHMLSMFNPKTRVIVVTDACHSGTMCDLRYNWKVPSLTPVLESEDLKGLGKGNVVFISGCMDSEVSLDYGERGGALTSSMLFVLGQRPQVISDLVAFVQRVRMQIASSGSSQISMLSTTFDLRSSGPESLHLFPVEVEAGAGSEVLPESGAGAGMVTSGGGPISDAEANAQIAQAIAASRCGCSIM